VQEHLSKRAKVAATFMAILLTITLTAMVLPEATAAPSPVEIVFYRPGKWTCWRNSTGYRGNRYCQWVIPDPF